MPERRIQANAKAVEFFDDIWSRGDYWQFETSEFERAKFQSQFALIADRHYPRALELGCGAGVFTRLLSTVCDDVTGVEISPKAVERARAMTPPELAQKIHYVAQNAMDFDLRQSGTYDLIVFSETLCYLGWLYPFFDVAWLAHELFGAVRPGGRLLMANTLGLENDYLLMPPVIHTYEDLFRNFGFQVEKQETFSGVKETVEVQSSEIVFVRPL